MGKINLENGNKELNVYGDELEQKLKNKNDVSKEIKNIRENNTKFIVDIGSNLNNITNSLSFVKDEYFKLMGRIEKLTDKLNIVNYDSNLFTFTGIIDEDRIRRGRELMLLVQLRQYSVPLQLVKNSPVIFKSKIDIMIRNYKLNSATLYTYLQWLEEKGFIKKEEHDNFTNLILGHLEDVEKNLILWF